MKIFRGAVTDVTYFEQVFHKFDSNSEIKKTSPALKSKSLKQLLKRKRIYQKILKNFNSKEKFAFREY